MGVFAALATLLAGVGVFGVSARGVARRRKELAVRICLGAEEQRLMGRVVRDGLLTGAPATLVGLIAAAWTGQLLSSLLFGVEPGDPLTFGAVASFLSLVIMTASYLPARTIARSDPARALRAEE
jgi:putative ABC transport system permease protein